MKINMMRFTRLREEMNEGGDGGGGGGDPAWYETAGVSAEIIGGEGAAEKLGAFDSVDSLVQAHLDNSSKTWDSSISEDTRAIDGVEGALEKFGANDNPVDALMKSYANAEKMARSKGEGIKPLAEGATDAERDAFFNAMGRPESVDGYDVKAFTEGEEAPFTSDDIAEPLAAMHKAGFTPGQVELAMKLGAENLTGGEDKFLSLHEDMTKETTANLKEMYGNEYAANIAGGMQVADKLGILDVVKQTGLANFQPFVEAMVTISKITSESKLPNFGKAPGGGDNVAQERGELMKHPAYNDLTHPEHDAIMQKIGATYKR